MNVNWDGYVIYHPGTSAPPHALPRADARRGFAKRMEERPVRIEMLRRLLRANGVELADTDDGIQELNDWFRTSVEADPDNPGRLTPEWYSVANDVALFLGDVMLQRCPQLRWEFYTWGAKNVSYQKHVIMGFSQVPNPKYNIDIDRRVVTYGHRLVAGRGSVPTYGRQTVRGAEIDIDAVAAEHRTREIEHDAFVQWVRTAESQA